jgi:CheY-like chemotaxis protein
MDTPLRILVVDDMAIVADAVARLLRQLGYDCTAVYDAHEALQVAQQLHPDLLIIDLGLPGVSGPELARRLRATPECHAALIAAHTAYSDPLHRRMAQDAGFDVYLVKPVDASSFIRLIALASARRARTAKLVTHACDARGEAHTSGDFDSAATASP